MESNVVSFKSKNPRASWQVDLELSQEDIEGFYKVLAYMSLRSNGDVVITTNDKVTIVANGASCSDANDIEDTILQNAPIDVIEEINSEDPSVSFSVSTNRTITLDVYPPAMFTNSPSVDEVKKYSYNAMVTMLQLL